MYRGDARQKMYDLNGALNDYNKALELFPSNVDALLCVGINFIYMKKYVEALENFTKAVELEPKNPNAYLYRAIGKQYKEQRTEAMADFNKAIQLAPDNADAYIKRGRNRFELKDYNGAIADYNSALKIDFKNSYAYFNRGTALCELQDLKGALADFNRVLELDPENALTYFIRADIKIELNDVYGAINDYSKVIDINPNNVFTYFNRGILWQKQKDYRRAIADYSKAIELNPDFASAYFNRAIARKVVGDYKGAANDYKKSEKIKTAHSSLDYKGKIDSSGLAKLIDFRADFEEGNVDVLKNTNIGIMRFSNYLINYQWDNTLSDNKYKFPEIAQLNSKLTNAGLFSIENDVKHIGRDTAEILADSLAKVENDSGCLLLAQSILCHRAENYNEALGKANQSVELNNANSLVYLNRANIMVDYHYMISSVNELNSNVFYIGNNPQRQNSKPKPDEIIADYKKCIELNPLFYPAYFNLANTLIDSKDYIGAISNLKTVIEIAPQNAEAWFNKGLIHIYLQESEEGCLDLSRAGELGVSSAYMVIKKYCK
jgi:tetratricopeptide (TPR) repeat protein